MTEEEARSRKLMIANAAVRLFEASERRAEAMKQLRQQREAVEKAACDKTKWRLHNREGAQLWGGGVGPYADWPTAGDVARTLQAIDEASGECAQAEEDLRGFGLNPRAYRVRRTDDR